MAQLSAPHGPAPGPSSLRFATGHLLLAAYCFIPGFCVGMSTVRGT